MVNTNTIRKYRILWLNESNSEVAHGEVFAMNDDDAHRKVEKLERPMPHIVNYELRRNYL